MEPLEPLYNERDELGELVYRLAKPDQLSRSLLVHPPDPSRDGLGCRDQRFGSLVNTPAPSRPKLEDLEAFGWAVVGPMSRWNAGQADGQEAQLLLHEAELGLKAFELGGATLFRGRS